MRGLININEILQSIMNMSWTSWATIGGAIILVIVTFIQAYEKDKADKKTEEEQIEAKEDRNKASIERKHAEVDRLAASKSRQEADDFFQKSIALQDEINKKSEETLTRANEIISKNEELIKLQSETIKNLTGYGNPLLMISPINKKQTAIIIHNVTDYPLQNIGIDMFDFSGDLKSHFDLSGHSPVIRLSVLNKYTIVREKIESISPRAVKVIPSNYEISGFKAFHIMMSTSHSNFHQYMFFNYDSESGAIKLIHFKLYETNRKTKETKLITEQKIVGSVPDDYFDKYFFRSFGIHYDIAEN